MPVAIRSHFIRRFVGAILLGGLFAVALGCGGGDTKMVPVSGKVTVNGKALTSGSVTYKPDKKKGNTFGEEPMGEINAQGEYTLSVRGKPGAPPGAYKVIVSSTGATTEDNTKVSAKNTVNPTYLSADITPLEVEVVKDPAPGRYDLKLTP
jgi:hypothetical protein